MTLLLGSGYCLVSASGKLVLPARMLAAMIDREPSGAVVIGRHPIDPCLRLHDTAYLQRLDQILRAREDDGDPFDSSIWNRRRILACAEPGQLSKQGAITLPSALRAEANINGTALLVCTGDTIEIWNPDIARESGEPFLGSLADRFLSAAA
jgi:MraZ protein